MLLAAGGGGQGPHCDTARSLLLDHPSATRSPHPPSIRHRPRLPPSASSTAAPGNPWGPAAATATATAAILHGGGSTPAAAAAILRSGSPPPSAAAGGGYGRDGGNGGWRWWRGRARVRKEESGPAGEEPRRKGGGAPTEAGGARALSGLVTMSICGHRCSSRCGSSAAPVRIGIVHTRIFFYHANALLLDTRIVLSRLTNTLVLDTPIQSRQMSEPIAKMSGQLTGT